MANALALDQPNTDWSAVTPTALNDALLCGVKVPSRFLDSGGSPLLGALRLPVWRIWCAPAGPCIPALVGEAALFMRLVWANARSSHLSRRVHKVSLGLWVPACMSRVARPNVLMHWGLEAAVDGNFQRRATVCECERCLCLCVCVPTASVASTADGEELDTPSPPTPAGTPDVFATPCCQPKTSPRLAVPASECAPGSVSAALPATPFAGPASTHPASCPGREADPEPQVGPLSRSAQLQVCKCIAGSRCVRHGLGVTVAAMAMCVAACRVRLSV